MSAYELSHVFVKPLMNQPINIPDDILKAKQALEAKGKLAPILRSKSPKCPSVKTGDTIQMFIKHLKDKGGKWTSPRTLLNIDHESSTITVPGTNRKVIKAALEDSRIAIDDNSYRKLVCDANDKLDFDGNVLLYD